MLNSIQPRKTEQFEAKTDFVQPDTRVVWRLAWNPCFTRRSGRRGHRALASSREEVQSPSTLTGAKKLRCGGHFGLWMQGVGWLDPAGCFSFAATEMLAHQAVSSPPTATRPVAPSDGQLSLSR